MRLGKGQKGMHGVSVGMCEQRGVFTMQLHSAGADHGGMLLVLHMIFGVSHTINRTASVVVCLHGAWQAAAVYNSVGLFQWQL
jgi:hypothetical protein